MEINKQLFEDVLSGKLKGTFVLRNGDKLNSSLLLCSGNIDNRVYAIGTDKYYIYYDDGAVRTYPYKPSLDIIDFIPETNMKENELTIEIPDGKIVDWDESKKQNKIVLKDKQLTYRDICRKLFVGYGWFFTDAEGGIHHTLGGDTYSCANNSATKHQLECILAKNKLANVAKYLNDGWEPGKTEDGHFDAYVLYTTPKRDHIGIVKINHCSENSNALFKSKELVQQAIEILGEETVKLALEPLGI